MRQEAFLPALASFGADDSVFFGVRVKPNVVLIMDDSGSIVITMQHPAYDGAVAPTCTFLSGYDKDDNNEDVVVSGNTLRVEVSNDPPYDGSGDFVSTYDSSNPFSHAQGGYV